MRVLLVILSLLSLSTLAHAECAWVLWGVRGNIYEPMRSFDTSGAPWRSWWSASSVKAKCEEAAREDQMVKAVYGPNFIASPTPWTHAGRKGSEPYWHSLEGGRAALLRLPLRALR